MKLIMENWRRFLAEADTVDDLPWRQTVREPLKPMDPQDVKTPVVGQARRPRGLRRQDGFGRQPHVTPEVPQVELTDEIQIHNANKLHEYFEEDTRIRSIFLSGWSKEGHPSWKEYQEKAKQYIDFVVANNPIFQKNKIVENLGAGSYGFVVGLDNDHALKVYVGSFVPTTLGSDPSAASDVERYGAFHEKAFGGTASVSELHIFREGEIETPFGRTWFYAEMPKIVSYSEHMRQVHAPGAEDVSDEEVKKLVATGKLAPEDVEDFRKYKASAASRGVSKTGLVRQGRSLREVTDRVNFEILFLKELAHLATLVDKHGAQAIAEFDPEEAYAQQHGRAFPEEHEDEIKLDPNFGAAIDTKSRADEPTQLVEFAELLGQDNIDAILPQEISLLDKTYAKNLFKQLKELLKTKTLNDLRDVRGANIGFYKGREKVPIVFDF